MSLKTEKLDDLNIDKVIKAVVPNVKGRADGKMINVIVKRFLG
jgi:uncharacterized protein YqeY